MKRTALCAALLSLALLSLRAEDQDPALLKREIETLEQRTVAVGLMRKLNLTNEQARALLPLAKEAGTAREEFQTRLLRLQEEQSKVFAEFRTQDLENEGFTPEVERATSRLDDREKDLRKAFSDHLAELEERAPFTEAQRALISRLKPENLRSVLIKEAPLPGEGPPDREKPKGEAERLRKELDEIHRAQYGAASPLGRLLSLPVFASVLAGRAGEKLETPSEGSDLSTGDGMT
ncbi:MAG: hypothetical protein HYY93_10965 [Planctomycetes bacterium]|nr:hypothetical protein [Planctomycetota bacterium]